jgi:ATP-dependent DNA helicase RecG
MWSTKLKKSNTSTKTINWNSTLVDLVGKASQKTIDKLNDAGVVTLYDLLWVFPLRVVELPPVLPFNQIEDQKLFIGRGRVVNVQARPNFRVRGKGKALLYNILVYIKDLHSDQHITLRWFNCYSSVKDKISKCNLIEFFGNPTIYSGQYQINNPEFYPIENIDSPSVFSTISNDLKIQYPTINTIAGIQIKKFIDKIPAQLWDQIEETLPTKILHEKNFISLADSFKSIHGKIKPNKTLEEATQKRLIYEEFFEGQLKLFLRRQYFKKPKAESFQIQNNLFDTFKTFFPHPLTSDQLKTIEDIRHDLAMEHPMMRLVQGDVGCGKTWVAFFASLIVIQKNAQVAFMCPTEALATQHFNEASHLFNQHDLRIKLILGSTPLKEKKRIHEQLAAGEIDLLIGTHALIQENIIFKQLGLAIIDEQHKFGVDQRIKLTSKGAGTHCLIMSATPIPRSLSLTQYGDLDISTIKTMPSGRKGHKTRIVSIDTYQQFLSFMKTRLSMKEQAYVVVPAITDNQEQDFHNLESILEKFKSYFPEFKVSALHGQMKSPEKAEVFQLFNQHKIDILISTSVIEVGINVINATIMAIMNPERFGLSSLHQLRGRVGRGDKPGFCFLVNDKSISDLSLERLKVIESNTDGFKIAEEDLRLRGEGDLFGKEQSGSITQNRFANIVTHAQILFEAKKDADILIKEENPEVFALLNKFSTDERIFTTV